MYTTKKKKVAWLVGSSVDCFLSILHTHITHALVSNTPLFNECHYMTTDYMVRNILNENMNIHLGEKRENDIFVGFNTQ